MKRRWLVPLATALWLTAVGVGFISLGAYGGSPGARPAPPERWPSVGAPARRPGAWTLVVFLHPRCPCTHASVSELARAAARFEEPADILAVFFVPEGADAAWAAGGLWEAAGRLPGARRIIDPGRRLARRFCAETSGLVALYDGAGARRFYGGLTAARGHEGQDVGGESLLAWLSGGQGAARSPVFGCPLVGAPEGAGEGGRACPPPR